MRPDADQQPGDAARQSRPTRPRAAQPSDLGRHFISNRRAARVWHQDLLEQPQPIRPAESGQCQAHAALHVRRRAHPTALGEPQQGASHRHANGAYVSSTVYTCQRWNSPPALNADPPQRPRDLSPHARESRIPEAARQQLHHRPRLITLLVLQDRRQGIEAPRAKPRFLYYLERPKNHGHGIERLQPELRERSQGGHV